MKKCSEYRDVSRADGSTVRRCAKFEDVPSDVLVRSDEDGDGLGLLVPKAISGLKNINMKTEVAGPAGGAAFTLLGTLLARRYGGMLHPVISENAPLAGMVIGAGLSIPLGSALKSPVVTRRGIVTSVIIGLTLWAAPKINGILSGAGPYVPSMGLLTAQPVGMLPDVQPTTDAPMAVSQTADVGVWGSTS